MGCAHSSSNPDAPHGGRCRRPQDTSSGVEHAVPTTCDAKKVSPATAAGSVDDVAPADPFEVDPLVLELHSGMDAMRRRSVGRRIQEPAPDRLELRLARAARAAQMGGMTDDLFQFVAEDLLPPDDPEADERVATWLVQQRDFHRDVETAADGVIQLLPPVLPVVLRSADDVHSASEQSADGDDDDPSLPPIPQQARRRSSALMPVSRDAAIDDRLGSFARRPAHGMSFDLSLDETSAATSFFSAMMVNGKAAGASRVSHPADPDEVSPGLPATMMSCTDPVLEDSACDRTTSPALLPEPAVVQH